MSSFASWISGSMNTAKDSCLFSITTTNIQSQ